MSVVDNELLELHGVISGETLRAPIFGQEYLVVSIHRDGYADCALNGDLNKIRSIWIDNLVEWKRRAA